VPTAQQLMQRRDCIALCRAISIYYHAGNPIERKEDSFFLSFAGNAFLKPFSYNMWLSDTREHTFFEDKRTACMYFRRSHES
jgi:hypothetical protein